MAVADLTALVAEDSAKSRRKLEEIWLLLTGDWSRTRSKTARRLKRAVLAIVEKPVRNHD